MDCKITYEGDLLMIRLVGVFNNEDLLELANLIAEVESRMVKTPHRVTDISKLTELNMTFEGMVAGVGKRTALIFPNRFKSAIVAPQPVQFGFARMFQTLNIHPQIDIRIFRDRASALAWVAEEEGDKVQVLVEDEL